eukprot:CAMPEP_0181034794 /NCGR_PEP_ID=MMETSP1070-20121207/7993_1 /TAXON_ID=265543 /ORGANISM="Minutocellus polymorphus, Strain NH13" /LENGTH=278 /DNA_ID=CAMNT_0023112337 /DNA_START=160 /DNA_END=993 /DNA_ORIENTATION=+
MKKAVSTSLAAASLILSVGLQAPMHVCSFSTKIGGTVPPSARAVTGNSRPLTWSNTDTTLHAGNGFGSADSDTSTSGSSSPPARRPTGEFELQEMRFQLSAMKKAGVSARNLSEEKKKEIAQYVREVVMRIPSPIPLKALADKDRLLGTWKMAFSTDAAAMDDLPREATITLDVKEGNQLDYKLAFSQKVWGLKEITARSNYFVDASPVNPGLLTYVYQDISAGVFGLKVPTGLFGMLKGREAYIESIWFDGEYWIARGFSANGEEYFSVYLKEEDRD